MKDIKPSPRWAVEDQCVRVDKMKELEEWSYQHPDRMSALSIIPLAVEES